MTVFLTNQKKLAAAVGISDNHMSQIKKGGHGISDDLAGKLEAITSIQKVTWASAGKKTQQLANSLKKFFREEQAREIDALKKISTRG